jgi:hypothetical protein
MFAVLRRLEHADIPAVHLLAGPRVILHFLHGAQGGNTSAQVFLFF